MQETNRVRVLIVDDHRLMAEGLRAAMETEPDIDVVGLANTVPRALQMVEETTPDVVLMDLHLPTGDGIDASTAIKAARPDTRVVILTGDDDERSIARAVTAGCDGFLTKTTSIEGLVEGVRRAGSGETVFAPDALAKVVRHLSHRDDAPSELRLSVRELEVLELLATGASTEHMATALFVSVHTIRSHVRHILEKLGAHSKLEAVAIALREGLVQPGGQPTGGTG